MLGNVRLHLVIPCKLWSKRKQTCFGQFPVLSASSKSK